MRKSVHGEIMTVRELGCLLGGGDITRFYCMPKIDFLCTSVQALKDKDYCPIEIIKGLTDKGQFQYLTKLMGPQVGNYLYTTQFLSLR